MLSFPGGLFNAFPFIEKFMAYDFFYESVLVPCHECYNDVEQSLLFLFHIHEHIVISYRMTNAESHPHQRVLIRLFA